MKKVFVLFLFFLLFISCTKNAEISFKGKNFYLTVDSVKIADIKAERWAVGPLRKQEVSKGIVVTIDFPEIDRESLDKLVQEFGVNSWLVRVRKRAFSVNTIVGHIYIPLIIPGTQSDNKYRRHQLKRGAISLYYPAAAVSKRFEHFSCPAFNHDRLVKGVEIEAGSGTPDKLYNSVVDRAYIQAPVVEFNYSGNILNAGESIIGEYEIDLALYNNKLKERITNFTTLNEVVIVKDETRVNINGCEGFQIPAKEEDVDKVKLFRWGK